MQIKASHCQIPSWAQTLNPLCAVAAACLFKGTWSRLSSLPPLTLHSTAPLPPPSYSPYAGALCCVAMETATWVCCYCLSFRCKRCTTHLTISWWMEGWWLRGTVRCLVARRTTFSLCRYSTACAWIHCSEVSTTFCLAVCSFTVQLVPGHA